MDRFHAKAAAGMVIDVNTGEVIALESLPDFDPNDPGDVRDQTKINRINVGVYEMGSTFKALSIAMALESGKVNLGSHVDARDSLRYGRFTIHDFHATHRVLTVPEVFTHSSNIGAARMALMVGVEGHKAFLRKMGQLDRLRTELPESAEPLVPKHWSLLNTMTIAFGQGLNVAPMQAVMAVARAGQRRRDDDADLPARAAKRSAAKVSHRVISEQTSEVHALSDALERDPRVAQVSPTFPAITSAARRAPPTRSSTATIRKNKVFTTFMAITPADKPKYLYLTIYDDPQAGLKTMDIHTAAYNAGRVAGALIRPRRAARGRAAEKELPTQPFPFVARLGYGADADKTRQGVTLMRAG